MDAGWGVSAFYGYLQGVNNELALKHVPHVEPRNDSLAGPVGRRGDQVGMYYHLCLNLPEHAILSCGHPLHS